MEAELAASGERRTPEPRRPSSAPLRGAEAQLCAPVKGPSGRGFEEADESRGGGEGGWGAVGGDGKRNFDFWGFGGGGLCYLFFSGQIIHSPLL